MKTYLRTLERRPIHPETRAANNTPSHNLFHLKRNISSRSIRTRRGNWRSPQTSRKRQSVSLIRRSTQYLRKKLATRNGSHARTRGDESAPNERQFRHRAWQGKQRGGSGDDGRVIEAQSRHGKWKWDGMEPHCGDGDGDEARTPSRLT